jgi:hypothetical protein
MFQLGKLASELLVEIEQRSFGDSRQSANIVVA